MEEKAGFQSCDKLYFRYCDVVEYVIGISAVLLKPKAYEGTHVRCTPPDLAESLGRQPVPASRGEGWVRASKKDPCSW